jgi:purine-nucleoside phosphorylase
MKVLGMSIITDECFPDALKAVQLSEILEAASSAEPKMTKIIKEIIGRM